MDVMELRRRMMALMANGAEVLKGTFTVPSNADVTYTFNFGKAFTSYVLLIEMTEESKQDLYNSGASSGSAYFYISVYPPSGVEENTDIGHATTCLAYNPSSGSFGSANMTSAGYTDSSITFNTKNVSSSGTSRVILGYSYNYIIISLDGIDWR